MQDIHCLGLRADYMIDQPTRSLKLVEYNTVASSFCCLANKVNEVHKYVMDKYGSLLPLNYDMDCDQPFDHKMLLDDENR